MSRDPGLSAPGALAIAIVLEGLMIGAGAMLVSRAQSNAAAEPPTLLVVEEPRLDKPPEPPKEEPKPPPPRKVEPVHVAPRLVPMLPPPEIVPPMASAVPDSPVSEPPPPPLPAQPLTRSEESVAREVQFADRLKAAIQAAVVYPAAARAMGLKGEARVEFVFRDGAVSNVRVVKGSGIGMLDQGAIAAVMNAAVPPIPESLRGREMSYAVTVAFDLKATR